MKRFLSASSSAGPCSFPVATRREVARPWRTRHGRDDKGLTGHCLQRGFGVLGMATRPDRHHASRRSSSVQAMAYTMATNRHITPKPGQGWRVWAEW